MADQSMSDQGLDVAKNRLRDALARLESTVDSKLEDAALAAPNDTQLVNELSHVRQSLKEKQKEIDSLRDNPISGDQEAVHLRDENQKLHAEIGQSVEQSKEMKRLNKRVATRVDSLVAELQAVLVE